MKNISRRAAVGALVTAPIAMPAILRAQGLSKPVRIGLLSDMGGPYRDVGGPGNRVAVEMAVADFGGSVLDRPIEVMQGDDQNKPDVAASLAREWIDNQGVDVLADGAASSSGLAIQQIAREKKRIYLITGPATSDMTGKQCSPYGVHFCLRHLRIGARHRRFADQGRRRYVVLHHRGLRLRLRAGTRHHRGGHGSRREGSGQRQSTAGDCGFLELPGAGEGIRREGHRLRQCRAQICRTASNRLPNSACRKVVCAWRRC